MQKQHSQPGIPRLRRNFSEDTEPWTSTWKTWTCAHGLHHGAGGGANACADSAAAAAKAGAQAVTPSVEPGWVVVLRALLERQTLKISEGITPQPNNLEADLKTETQREREERLQNVREASWKAVVAREPTPPFGRQAEWMDTHVCVISGGFADSADEAQRVGLVVHIQHGEQRRPPPPLGAGAPS